MGELERRKVPLVALRLRMRAMAFCTEVCKLARPEPALIPTAGVEVITEQD